MSDFSKKVLDTLSGQPVSTTSPVNLVTITQEITNGRLDSFTFTHQREIFPYINTIGDLIESEIPIFTEIWPLLGAYTENGHWHHKLDTDLEFIGIAHYTVLKSLCYIVLNKDKVVPNDPDQKYKNVIFHYALIIDCIKQLCFHIIKFQSKLDPSKEFPVKMLSKEALFEELGKWFCKDYSKKYKAFETTGGLIMKEIHNVDKFIKILNKNGEFNAFNAFRKDKIGPLRNVFIHNPSIDLFWKGREILVVRPKYIKDNKTIQSINRLPRESLIEPFVLMNELFSEALTVIRDVWLALYKEIEFINTHDNFNGKKLKTD